MVDAAVRTATTPPDDEAPRIDVDRVGDLLLGTWADTRRTAREMIKDPAFWRKDDLSMNEHRERVLSQLHLLVDNKAVHRAFPKEYGGEDNNGANISGFEELVAADPSLQIKAGVQWGLFGSAILQAGHEGAPPQVDARSDGPLHPRRVRHDRDRPRFGRRSRRNDGGLRPRKDQGVRDQHPRSAARPKSSSATPPCTVSRPPCSRS